MSQSAQMRMAFVSKAECKPSRCRQECRKACPVNKTGKKCIEVTPKSKKAYISEQFCIGCGICIKRCPFNAIQILNLPGELNAQAVHRFGANTFKLHRLPVPRPGKVLGLVGTNGIGKSTALGILSGALKPNLGQYDKQPEWSQILKHFRGSELQSYFTRQLEDEMVSARKPQYVENIAKKMKGTVEKVLKKNDQKNGFEKIVGMLEMEPILKRKVPDLSGGELQRLAIAVVWLQNADVYFFDEPSSYLDVHQRLKAAEAIRSLLQEQKEDGGSGYVVVVEHDLSVLDYLSDYVCVLHGKPGAYGIVTTPFSVREGINHFLEGYIPTENLRFRDSQMSFRFNEGGMEFEKDSTRVNFRYPDMERTQGNFKLKIKGGAFQNSEIIVMLGRNGTGKTTFIKLLAKEIKPDDEIVEIPDLCVSYKPQTIQSDFVGSVRSLLHKKIRGVYTTSTFVTDVIRPLKIYDIIDRDVATLSGGELQRLSITLCVGKKADLYLFDEPSAYLDSEQRMVASKVIKKFILGNKKTAFVVEHDFIMATYLADKIIVYEGQPAKKCIANPAETLENGMNRFLKALRITFRRDPTNFRPRINKMGSQKDQEQKNSGDYFASKA